MKKPTRQNSPKFHRLRRLAKGGLANVKQDTYSRWAAEHYKNSKYSMMEELPSSQLPPKVSIIDKERPQLFVVIDTCSIIKYREKFLAFVTKQKELYRESSPIRFILTIPVLEELDNHGKSSSRARKPRPQKQPEINLVKSNENITLLDHDTDLVDFVTGSRSLTHTPRYLFRIIEEETRTHGVLISDLDPANKTQLSEVDKDFEIVNNDDRILHRCLVSRQFILNVAHHKDTKVILVAEDNILKIKATTRGIVSYRWLEFECKFKNFGLRNCISTPLSQPITSRLRNKQNTCLVIKRKRNKSNKDKIDDDIIIIKEIKAGEIIKRKEMAPVVHLE